MLIYMIKALLQIVEHKSHNNVELSIVYNVCICMQSHMMHKLISMMRFCFFTTLYLAIG